VNELLADNFYKYFKVKVVDLLFKPDKVI